MTLYSLNALCISRLLSLLPSISLRHFLIFNSYMEWYMGNYIALSDVVVYFLSHQINRDRRFRDPTIIYDGYANRGETRYRDAAIHPGRVVILLAQPFLAK